MKKIIFFGLLWMVAAPIEITARAAVAPGPAVGRMGNSLWNYCLAKWVAKKNRLPFFYRPFKNGEEKLFAFSQLESCVPHQHFQQIIALQKDDWEQKIAESKNKNVLFSVPFGFREQNWSTWFDHIIRIFKKDTAFIEELRGKIRPLNQIEIIEKPENVISVALHVRKGGGYPADDELIYKKYPCKFPPDSFYIEQLVKLYYMLEQRPLFIYIFTDDPHPEHLVATIENTIHLPQAIYAYREPGNFYEDNMIDDLFNMTTFDYLIRPDSTFSQVAEIIGNHKMTIYPEIAHLDDDKRLFYIAKVGVNIYDRSLKKFTRLFTTRKNEVGHDQKNVS